MPLQENNSLKNCFKIALKMENLFLSGKGNCISLKKKKTAKYSDRFYGETFAIPIKPLLL